MQDALEFSPKPPVDLELRADSPHVLGSERRFRADQFPLIPRFTTGEHATSPCSILPSIASSGVAISSASRSRTLPPPGHAVDRGTVCQKKTGRPVRFEMTEQTREANYIKATGKEPPKLFRDPLASPDQGDTHLPSHEQPCAAAAGPQKDREYGPLSRNRG